MSGSRLPTACMSVKMFLGGHLNGNQEMLLETLPGLLQQTCARRGKVL